MVGIVIAASVIVIVAIIIWHCMTKPPEPIRSPRLGPISAPNSESVDLEAADAEDAAQRKKQQEAEAQRKEADRIAAEERKKQGEAEAQRKEADRIAAAEERQKQGEAAAAAPKVVVETPIAEPAKDQL